MHASVPTLSVGLFCFSTNGFFFSSVSGSGRLFVAVGIPLPPFSKLHLVPRVTESGVRPLAAQKPIKRRGWWKGKMLYCGCWQRGGEGRGDSCPKADSPLLTVRGQELL